MAVYIEDGKADSFVEHLRSLPTEEAVTVATDALRCANRKQNTNVLFRSKAFTQWVVRKDVLSVTEGKPASALDMSRYVGKTVGGIYAVPGGDRGIDGPDVGDVVIVFTDGSWVSVGHWSTEQGGLYLENESGEEFPESVA